MSSSAVVGSLEKLASQTGVFPCLPVASPPCLQAGSGLAAALEWIAALDPASTQLKEAAKGTPLPPPLVWPVWWLPRPVEKPVSILDIQEPWCLCLLESGDIKRSHSLSHILQSWGITPPRKLSSPWGSTQRPKGDAGGMVPRPAQHVLLWVPALGCRAARLPTSF